MDNKEAEELWKKYIEYLRKWIEDEKDGTCYCRMSPMSFEEWREIEK